MEPAQLADRTFAKIVLTVLVGAAGVRFGISSVDHAPQYRLLDQLIAGGLDDWDGDELRVHGYITAGSIREQVVDQELRRTFVLQRDGKQIRVFSVGLAPDTLKDHAEVVVSGRLVPAAQMRPAAVALCDPTWSCAVDAEQAWVIEMTEILGRCPTKYEGPQTLGIRFE